MNQQWRWLMSTPRNRTYYHQLSFADKSANESFEPPESVGYIRQLNARIGELLDLCKLHARKLPGNRMACHVAANEIAGLWRFDALTWSIVEIGDVDAHAATIRDQMLKVCDERSYQ